MFTKRKDRRGRQKRKGRKTDRIDAGWKSGRTERRRQIQRGLGGQRETHALGRQRGRV